LPGADQSPSSRANIEAAQPLGPTSNPTFYNATFNSMDTIDDATSRNNFGLGSLAIRNPGAAMVNLAGAVSNPPTQDEAQANRDKISELLNSLRVAGIIFT
jgi:hypothetical protein